MQRRERQREVGRERGHADAADQADDGNDHAALAALGAPAGFADFQQSAGGLAGVKRHEQNLVGTRAQRPLNQPGGARREHGKQAWARRMKRLALQKTQRSLFVAVDHHERRVGRRGGILGKIRGGGSFALDYLEFRLAQRGQHRLELSALFAKVSDQQDLHRAAVTLAL